MRRVADICLVVSMIACTGRPLAGDQGETGQSSTESSTGSGVDETETDTDTSETETGEQPEPCPVDPAIGIHSIQLEDSRWVFDTWTRACTVDSIAGTNDDTIYIDCPDNGSMDLIKFEIHVDYEGFPTSFPLEPGQAVEVELFSGADGIAWAIRESDTKRALMAYYESTWLPAEAPQGADVPSEDFFAPLLLNSRDGLCDTLCENFMGPGVPPECDCRRQLGVEARLAVDEVPQLILDGSGGPIPGEPGGHLTVMDALAREDCFDPDYPHSRFSFLFVSL